MTYRLKIVPDDDPDASGEFVSYEGTEKPTFDTVLRKGWHVVKIEQHLEDRSGESMYVSSMRSIYG